MKASMLHGPMAVHSQQQLLLNMVPALAAVDTGCGGGSQMASLFQQIAPPTVFSEPESEPTCNLSGSRKRARDEGLPSSNILYRQQQFLLQKQLLGDALPAEASRVNQSAMASTSGRQPLSAAQPSVAASPGNNNANISIAPGSFSSNLTAMLHHHSLEMGALIRLHAEKLRLGLDAARKCQCRAVEALEQQAQRRVVEKQAELLAAANRNAELEERLRQATAERQAWFNAARNSEGIVAGLRASLEQALLQKFNCGSNNTNGNHNGDCAPGEDLLSLAATKEGYGDSEEEAASAAVSCPAGCVEANKPFTGGGCLSPCKSCDQADACVLILPCRHLCICAACEPSVNDCPVCGRRKNASLQISLA